MRIFTLALFITILAFAQASFARDTYVQGYTRKDGTYVQPHYRTKADNSQFNNYSTKGNVNPYNGKAGTVDPYGMNSNHSYGNSSGLYGGQTPRRRGY
jgi:hypothetical protein